MNDHTSIEDLKRRIRELKKENRLKDRLSRTLFEITDAVSTTDDLNEFYQSIYESLNRLMNLPNFYIALYDSSKNTIRFPFHEDETDDATFTGRYFLYGQSLTSEVIIKKKLIFLNEFQLKKRKMENRVVGPTPKTWIGAPLMIRKKVIGVVAIQHYHNPDYFSNADVDILKAASRHIALAIERKRSLDERDLLENYLYNIINSMPSILISIDKDLKITHWNSQAELETGLSESQVVGKKLTRMFPRLSGITDNVQSSIRSNKIKTLLKHNYTIDSTRRYEDIIIYPISADKVDGAVIRIDDISEKVLMEEIMIQSEKMMSIGGLAAGMAHEINNPLAGMMQNAQVVHNRLSADLQANKDAAERAGIPLEAIQSYMKDRDILKKLQTISEAGNRAARIVKNMLSFARKRDTVLESADMTELILKTLELAKSDYNLKKKYDFKGIKIETDFARNLPLVRCDESKIQQVFLNILKNGAHAMFQQPDKNKPPCFLLKTYAEKKHVCIQIKDNGPGVEETISKRLFEPFYTTKPVGEGTGLGLSVSYFIVVDDHKGELLVKSSPGKGTSFIIKLPLHPPQKKKKTSDIKKI